MTLEEAIKHCYEVYDRLEAQGTVDCECAEEHKQLAEWLEELKEYRNLKLVCFFDGYVVYKEKDND